MACNMKYFSEWKNNAIKIAELEKAGIKTCASVPDHKLFQVNNYKQQKIVNVIVLMRKNRRSM